MVIKTVGRKSAGRFIFCHQPSISFKMTISVEQMTSVFPNTFTGFRFFHKLYNVSQKRWSNLIKRKTKQLHRNYNSNIVFVIEGYFYTRASLSSKIWTYIYQYFWQVWNLTWVNRILFLEQIVTYCNHFYSWGHYIHIYK